MKESSDKDAKKFWPAQLIKLYNLVQLGDIDDAKKIQKEISLNCQDQEVVKDASAIEF